MATAPLIHQGPLLHLQQEVHQGAGGCITVAAAIDVPLALASKETTLANYDQDEAGGLWVGKDYGPGSAYHRIPCPACLTEQRLSRPGISHKFVKGLEAYPNLEIIRKSGTWKTYNADSALVRTEGLAYIMIALANNANGAAWLEQLAAPLHELAVSQNAQTP